MYQTLPALAHPPLPARPARPDPQATIATISRLQHEAGITDTSLLNFVVADGATLVATRFVSNERDAAASLYYAGAAGGAAELWGGTGGRAGRVEMRELAML